MAKKLASAELFDAAAAADLITKGGGGWLSIGSQRLGQGRDKSIQSIEENEELRTAVETALKTKDDLSGDSSHGATSELAKNAGGTSYVESDIETPPRHDKQERTPEVTTIDLSFPLPSDIPHNALQAASVVVKSKSDKGFRRAGYGFAPQETIIPYADIPAETLGALVNERELIVKLRIARP